MSMSLLAQRLTRHPFEKPREGKQMTLMLRKPTTSLVGKPRRRLGTLAMLLAGRPKRLPVGKQKRLLVGTQKKKLQVGMQKRLLGRQAMLLAGKVPVGSLKVQEQV